MNRYMSSVKVLVFMSALGAVSVFADSGDAVNGVDELKGFNVGLDLMYSHIDVKHSTTHGDVVYFGNHIDDNSVGELKHKRCCLEPVINLGYSLFLHNWYIGVSGDLIFGGSSKRSGVFVGNPGTESKVKGISYTVKVKAGRYFDGLDSSIYGILGLKWQDVRMSLDTKFNRCDFRDSKLKNPAVVLGIGIEKPVWRKLSFCAEYEYSWRKSTCVSVAKKPEEIPECTFLSTDVNQRYHENSFRVGLKYHI